MNCLKMRSDSLPCAKGSIQRKLIFFFFSKKTNILEEIQLNTLSIVSMFAEKSLVKRVSFNLLMVTHPQVTCLISPVSEVSPWAQ